MCPTGEGNYLYLYLYKNPKLKSRACVNAARLIFESRSRPELFFPRCVKPVLGLAYIPLENPVSKKRRNGKTRHLFSAKKRRNSSKTLPNHAKNHLNHVKIVAKNLHLLITTFAYWQCEPKNRKWRRREKVRVLSSITCR